jgi:hypothetical protein
VTYDSIVIPFHPHSQIHPDQEPHTNISRRRDAPVPLKLLKLEAGKVDDDGNQYRDSGEKSRRGGNRSRREFFSPCGGEPASVNDMPQQIERKAHRQRSQKAILPEEISGNYVTRFHHTGQRQ